MNKLISFVIGSILLCLAAISLSAFAQIVKVPKDKQPIEQQKETKLAPPAKDPEQKPVKEVQPNPDKNSGGDSNKTKDNPPKQAPEFKNEQCKKGTGNSGFDGCQ
jgi:hypothetical protein